MNDAAVSTDHSSRKKKKKILISSSLLGELVPVSDLAGPKFSDACLDVFIEPLASLPLSSLPFFLLLLLNSEHTAKKKACCYALELTLQNIWEAVSKITSIEYYTI